MDCLSISSLFLELKRKRIIRASHAEIDIVSQDIAKIALLIEALAPDHGFTYPNDDVVRFVLIANRLRRDLADGDLDPVGAQGCPFAAVLIERAKHVLRMTDILILTIDTKKMAAMGDTYAESFLHLF